MTKFDSGSKRLLGTDSQLKKHTGGSVDIPSAIIVPGTLTDPAHSFWDDGVLQYKQALEAIPDHIRRRLLYGDFKPKPNSYT